MATLTEIRENWTIDDVLDCHEIINYLDELETKEIDKSKV